MKVEAELQDLLVIGFALRTKEIERLAPKGLRLETCEHDDEKHGFMVLGLQRYTEFFNKNFPILSFDFPAAYLGICIEDKSHQSALYLKRIYTPGLQSFLFNWIGGLPTRKLSFDYPTSAHAGGEYRWELLGDGAGELLGKIDGQRGVSGRLTEFFGGEDEMVDFFWNRPTVYTGPTSNLRRMNVSVSPPDFHPVIFDKLELGFLASDLERNQFPESIVGSFFVPESSLKVEGPVSVSGG